MTDMELKRFLRALDAAVQIDLTDWEVNFLGDTIDLYRFSPKQREVIERLMDKYVGKIGYKLEGTPC